MSKGVDYDLAIRDAEDVLDALKAAKDENVELRHEIEEMKKQIGDLDDQVFELDQELQDERAAREEADNTVKRWAAEVMTVRGTIGRKNDGEQR